MLPSSQSSPVSMLPLPQLVSQACVVWRRCPNGTLGSLVQVFEQPRIAASGTQEQAVRTRAARRDGHGAVAAVAALVALLHAVAADRDAVQHAAGVPVQTAPGSMRQVAEQPSSARRVPVVALLAALDHAVAARGNALATGHAALVTGLDRLQVAPSSRRRDVVLPSSHASVDAEDAVAADRGHACRR